MAKMNSVKASFTGREMAAIAAMLLSSEGINVDPIVDDLYPDLEEEQKSMFRCKLALMLKGNLPEFQNKRGFKRTDSRTAYLYEIVGESSLLGVYRMKKISKYILEKTEDKEDWTTATLEDFEKDNIESQGFDFVLYDNLAEAIKNW